MWMKGQNFEGYSCKRSRTQCLWSHTLEFLIKVCQANSLPCYTQSNKVKASASNFPRLLCIVSLNAHSVDRIWEQGLLPQGFPQTEHISFPEAFTSSWTHTLCLCTCLVPGCPGLCPASPRKWVVGWIVTCHPAPPAKVGLASGNNQPRAFWSPVARFTRQKHLVCYNLDSWYPPFSKGVRLLTSSTKLFVINLVHDLSTPHIGTSQGFCSLCGDSIYFSALRSGSASILLARLGLQDHNLTWLQSNSCIKWTNSDHPWHTRGVESQRANSFSLNEMQAQYSWYWVKNYFPGDSVTAIAARSSNLKCYVQIAGPTEPHSSLRTKT